MKEKIEEWFAKRGWSPFPFQREVWQSYCQGAGGMLYSSTGTGKTYAAFFAPLIEAEVKNSGCRILWITPLRALANDLAQALALPLKEMGLDWSVEIRSGDTSSYRKKKQLSRLPEVLITTPESMTLLLSYEETIKNLQSLDMVVVDEWHELVGTKRGVQTELLLARLRSIRPDLRVWGLSATLGNVSQALSVLQGLGNNSTTPSPALVTADTKFGLHIKSLIPDEIELFPWAGHLNTIMVPSVVEAIESNESTLLFTNTRSQAERWYQEILNYKDDLAGCLALHHGSLDPEIRHWVEKAVDRGILKCVVCTSSLDLGVDFSPVDHVIQLGSPKGVARLLQRSGRSGHRPGLDSRVTFVPTNCLELIELSACRLAIEEGRLEARSPLNKPLDVLIQHLVTVAAGGGFVASELLTEVRTTHAYRDLSDQEWRWVLDFVQFGGSCLGAYPEYRRVELDPDQDKFVVSDPAIARRHRMSIGTITSDSSMQVRFLQGKTIGVVEESFISKLKRGDNFIFGGRVLELVRVREMTAYVRASRGRRASLVRYMGGKMPLSSELSRTVRLRIAQAGKEIYADQEMEAVRPVLELQKLWSKLPAEDEILIEQVESREGFHLFFFPFEGRNVHEGLSALIAYRLCQEEENTFTISVNDYGFELLSARRVELDLYKLRALFSLDDLDEDILRSINATEMARRHFREIARVAGLVFQGYPGAGKSTRQIQASSELFFDVFKEYDPQNLLLLQAKRELLAGQLESSRLMKALERIRSSSFVLIQLEKPSPLSFPILVDRLREKLSSERFETRVARMQMAMAKHARSLYAGSRTRRDSCKIKT
ncbi:MAG: ligase-associated DNA damage response DEXH box helicase [Cyanobacteria bacterium HKST-UBA01]|nr:ligase-associated DNA damage response DEXH box helicase [Cyanobacteria bacterium HKST-UBA01]